MRAHDKADAAAIAAVAAAAPTTLEAQLLSLSAHTSCPPMSLQ
jgi:hypothetical protein